MSDTEERLRTAMDQLAGDGSGPRVDVAAFYGRRRHLRIRRTSAAVASVVILAGAGAAVSIAHHAPPTTAQTATRTPTLTSASVPAPALKGVTVAASRVRLASAGLVLGPITQVHSTAAPAGAVLDQTPSAGHPTPKGDPVAVEVSLGPGPTMTRPIVSWDSAGKLVFILAGSSGCGGHLKTLVIAGPHHLDVTTNNLDGPTPPGTLCTADLRLYTTRVTAPAGLDQTQPATVTIDKTNYWLPPLP
jgi:hypothetical protein